MTDIFENQTAFEGTTPPSSTEGGKPNGKTKTPRRKARGARKTTAAPAPVVAEPVKKRGRPAGAKSAKGGRGRPAAASLATRPPVGTQPNGTGKLLLSIVGLDEAETSFVASMLAALENHPKKSRAKIVGALGRIFA